VNYSFTGIEHDGDAYRDSARAGCPTVNRGRWCLSADAILSMGIRSWRPHGRLQRLDADCGEDGVEAPRELGVPVTDEEPESPALVLEIGHQVARHLGDPGVDRVPRHSEEVDDARLDLNDEKDI
jgi:hypothetical protein